MVVEDMESVAPIACFYSLRHASASVRGSARVGQPGAGSPQAFNVRLADSAGSRRQARILLQRMYAWRGYADTGGADDSVHQDEGEDIRLVAETGGALVGTMSLCLERAGRLPADENFGDRLALLRRQGRRLCEPTRLAIDAGMSKQVFAALIHVSYLYAKRLRGFSDYVIEVNPRHVAFYRRMLGFEQLGGERPCSRVGAPAVLLHLPLERMGAQIARWGGGAGDPGAGDRKSVV